ncbi:MAG: hypothetical protein Q4P14_04695 [Methanobacteriaceae archaeon]|nr:hypothetical protein [Methanobacteriaceae archaeon]
MSLFISTTPRRLNKRTWAEKHRAQILTFYAVMIILFVFILAALSVQPTIAGVV